ncbi:MAG: phosphatase PAP2 family protein [Bacteroidaceae bacterium]|nr:phosphatase PAP2 family protein [Bacteroidaceae bacterium]
MNDILSWNKSLFLLLNGSDSLYLDGVMWTVTHTVTWVPLMLVLLYIIIKNNTWRNSLFIILTLALLVTITDQTASGLCKPYFKILRPTHDPELAPLVDIVNGYRGGLYGFFSSHAANTFGVAIFLSLLFRSWTISGVLYFYAVLCSYSRIYLGVHSPIDILVGMLFGTLAGLLMYLVFHFLERKFSKRISYYSSTYTSTGYRRSDFVLLILFLALILLYVAFNALYLASRF